jgi:hypothetical protein
MIWWHVLLYSSIGCGCMVVKDVVGTVLVDAIANGKHKLAGNMDFLGDIVGIVLASYSGVQLIHLGWPGWLGILPIGFTGKFVTQRAVKWSHHNIEQEPDDASRA